MKTIHKLFIYIILYSNFAFSQTQGVVDYELILDISFMEQVPDAKFVLPDINKHQNGLLFELVFDKEKSLFNRKYQHKSQTIKFIESIAYFRGIFFTKNNESFFKPEGVLLKKDELFVKYEKNDNWEIHDEYKMIEGFRCYKATTTRTSGVESDKLNFMVTAWFTPEIPFSLGPIGFGGLPGLILELNYNKATYGARKIDLRPLPTLNILLPNKGKLITEKEFINLLNERSKAMSDLFMVD